MKSKALDELVASGTILAYDYREISDTNRNNDDIWYQQLKITFTDGKVMVISPGLNRSLIERIDIEVT